MEQTISGGAQEEEAPVMVPKAEWARDAHDTPGTLVDGRIKVNDPQSDEATGTTGGATGGTTGGATGGALVGAAAGLLLFFTAVASFSAVGAGLAGLLTTVSLVVGAAGSALTAAGGDLAAIGVVAGVSAERGASAAGFG